MVYISMFLMLIFECNFLKFIIINFGYWIFVWFLLIGGEVDDYVWGDKENMEYEYELFFK